MITAARLRECDTRGGLIALLADLGYPSAPVELDTAEWRRSARPSRRSTGVQPLHLADGGAA